MTINGINGANTQMGMNQAADSYSRNIQKQILNAQKQLQEISSNENMTSEEKMKRRQEIQQQISDLNMQLRQHQVEQRREKQQQVKDSSMNDTLGGRKNVEGKSSGLSQAGMTAMISADTFIKQAKVQGSAATKMEGRAGVLKSEIKLDKARGGDTQKKEEELAEVEQKAQAARSSQLSALAGAGKTMEEAAKADGKSEKTDTKAAKKKDPDEKMSGADTQGETVNIQSEISVSKSEAAFETAAQPTTYTSIDIRL